MTWYGELHGGIAGPHHSIYESEVVYDGTDDGHQQCGHLHRQARREGEGVGRSGSGYK